MHARWSGLPGWHILGLAASPVLGPEGNRAFLTAAKSS
jgi:23S rRNA (cytidine1920-2'-O)/16S rRNA (cytidine1409-2'-O)-methyltransferase